ncbi:MAG: DUF624 domain-containing protein [Ruminococcaceae bacterium]|nr:DUF624 domain-containing protein [Oscillospiraceae bacterium]
MFRFINYEKPGKGIDPNAPKKRPFFLFLELFCRKLFTIMQMNVVYLICCIPIITIGPATAAMTFIFREVSEERPIFLWNDFRKAMKRHFKQGFFVGLINAILWFMLILDGLILYSRLSVFTMIILGLLGIISIVFLMMQIYLYPLLITGRYTVLDIYKNAFLLALSKIYQTLGILFIIGLVSWALYSVAFLSLFLLAFFYFATVNFISVFFADRILKQFNMR